MVGEEWKGSGVPGGETSRWRVQMHVSTREKSLSEDLADLEDWESGDAGVHGVVGGVDTVVEGVVEAVVSVGVVLCKLGAGKERGGCIAPKRLRTASKHCLSARGVGVTTGLGASGGMVDGMVGSKVTNIVGWVACGMGGAGARHGALSGEGERGEVQCGRAAMGLRMKTTSS